MFDLNQAAVGGKLRGASERPAIWLALAKRRIHAMPVGHPAGIVTAAAVFTSLLKTALSMVIMKALLVVVSVPVLL